jgi:hypothetical protein
MAPLVLFNKQINPPKIPPFSLMNKPTPNFSTKRFPGIPLFFASLHCWMPDQVRHDRQKLRAFFIATQVCCAGMAKGNHSSPFPLVIFNNILKDIYGA